MIEKRMTCSRSAMYSRSDYQLASPLYYTVFYIYLCLVLYYTVLYRIIVSFAKRIASHRIASYHTQFTQRIQVYE